jgi:hypothetical protein
VVLLVLRRKKPAPPPTLALPAPVGELERVLEARVTARASTAAEPAGEPANLLPGKTVRDRVLDAVRADVDRTAGVLTAWLAEAARPADPKAQFDAATHKGAR